MAEQVAETPSRRAARKKPRSPSVPTAPARAKAVPPQGVQRGKLVRLWMVVALIGAVLSGAGAGLWYYDFTQNGARVPPKPDLRFQAIGRRLRIPPNVSPHEEYPSADGRTVYLTQDQFRAVNLAALLPHEQNLALAQAIAEPNRDKQAELLLAMAAKAPKGKEGDEEALAVFYLAEGLLSLPTPTPTQARALEDLGQSTSCRFQPVKTVPPMMVPECKKPPSMTLFYVLLAASGVLLVAFLGGLAVNATRRTRAPA